MGMPVQLYDVNGAVVTYGFTPLVITTKTTTLVKSGPGMIGGIQISLLGTADTLTVYDALTATGTPILELVAPVVSAVPWLPGALFTVGLCIVSGGTTAGKYNVLYA